MNVMRSLEVRHESLVTILQQSISFSMQNLFRLLPQDFGIVGQNYYKGISSWHNWVEFLSLAGKQCRGKCLCKKKSVIIEITKLVSGVTLNATWETLKTNGNKNWIWCNLLFDLVLWNFSGNYQCKTFSFLGRDFSRTDWS